MNRKLGRESSNSADMKSIVVRLEIPELTEFLPAVIELAGERLCLLMNNLVGSHVAFLRKLLTADVTLVRPFASMASFVSAKVSPLRKALVASWSLTSIRFRARMRPIV